MSVNGVEEAAKALVASLEDAQRDKLRFSFDDEAERTTWYYWPAPRGGLPLGEMTSEQRTLALRVLASGLSLQGYAKATQIIALERVLDEMEGHVLPRDPALYFVTLFGDPGADRWGWRFEGHHVSVHITSVDGGVAVVPSFLGANPAVVAHHGHVVSRPLAAEEDAGRALLASLDEAQRAEAVVSPDAPEDILTSNAVEVGDLPGGGIPASNLRQEQRALLERLVRVYLERAPDSLAASEIDRVTDAGWERLTFAWAGPDRPGERHYYRVTGPTLVIEYDNTQNDANHIHAVWRDRERDFGRDLLREHLKNAHEPHDGAA